MPIRVKITDAEVNYKELGIQALRSRNWLEAIDHFQNALDADPADVEVLNYLAVAQSALGNAKEARSTLGRAIALSPEFSEPYRNIAVLLANDGRFLEAAENACRAVELDPKSDKNVEVLISIRSSLRELIPKAKKSRRKRRKATEYTVEEINSCLAKIKDTLKKIATVKSVDATTSVSRSLSLCMIVKNEEKNISGCLESVKGLVDEVIVVDTGSIDRTKEIAESHGAKVYDFAWTDNFSAARNEAVRHATSDWILVLDADERLDVGAHQLIQKAITNPSVDAYFLPIYNYKGENPGVDVFVHRTCRLFRNRSEYKYEGRVHERIANSIQRSGGRFEYLPAIIHHYGYQPSVIEEKQKHEKYIQLLLADLAERPGDVFCLYNLAATYTSSGDYENAVQYLTQALPFVSPKHEFGYAVYSLLAQVFCRLGKSEEAIDILERALQVGFDHPELHFWRGNALLETGRYNDAIAEFEKTIRLGKKGFWIGDQDVFGYKALLGIASGYMGIGDYFKVAENCEKVIQMYPDSSKAHELLCIAYACMGRVTKAEYHIRECLRVNNGNFQVLHELAETLLAQRKYKESEYVSRKIIELGNESSTVYLNLADSLRFQGKLEEAEKYYSKAVALEPKSVEAYIGLGKNYAAQGDFQKALDCFAKCVDIDPQCANAYFSAGDVLYSIGRFQEAADVYQNGLACYPWHALGFLALGNCYFKMQAYEAAVLAYRKTLDIDPNCKEAANNLHLCMKQLKQVA
jgi:tetratricopeptide (TPR) repeat protein